MRDRIHLRARGVVLNVLIGAGIILSMALAGCRSPKPAEQAEQKPAEGPQRYHLSGRVVSVEAPKQQVVVDAGDIPGFMAAMTMGYSVKNPSLLAPLAPEDQITADVVVNGNDVYLENIVVTKKAEKSKAPSGSTAPPATSQPAKP